MHYSTNTMKNLYRSIIIASAILFAGCTQDALDEDVAKGLVGMSIEMRLSSPEAFTGEVVSAEKRLVRTKQTLDTKMALSELVASTDQWEIAHKMMVKELARPSEVPQYKREQIAALLMLQTHLKLEKLPEGAMDAVGFYTELLTKNHSPEAPLITTALAKMKGHWNEEELSNAAIDAKKGVAQFLYKRYNCEACNPAVLGAKMSKAAIQEISSNQDKFLTESLASISTLDSYIIEN